MSTPSPALPRGFQATLEAARQGDGTAVEELFQAFYPRVERMVHLALSRDLRRSRPWLLARFSTGDVVQEVFRGLLRDLTGFRGEGEEAFSGYLAMVVRNRLLDAVRFHEAAQRDGRRTLDAVEESDPAGAENEPLQELATAEELERFHQVLESFEEREQLLLRGRLEQELGFQELADRLGYSSKFAARRAYYSVQALLVIRLRQSPQA